MPRGRKPKSAEQHKIGGTFQPCRHSKVNPMEGESNDRMGDDLSGATFDAGKLGGGTPEPYR